MSNDGLLPKGIFGKLHETYGTPYIGTILTGLVIAIVAGLVPIETIAKLVNIGTLLAFTMVCAAVLVMRFKEPNIKRTFKVPYLPVIASLGIVFNVGMMLSLQWENWLRLAIWLAIGLAVYFLYSQRHSVLNRDHKTLNDKY
jgi:APA family basic amino acid/polyamine antiporter